MAPVAICGTRFIPRFSHKEKAMPSEGPPLCFSGDEPWDVGKVRLPQIGNHHDKANP